MHSRSFRLAKLNAVFTACFLLAFVLTLSLFCPSARAEEVLPLPNHLHRISTFPSNEFGHLYDECIMWRSDDEIFVATQRPVKSVRKLTKEELPAYLTGNSEKSPLLILYTAKKASKYPIPIEEVFLQLAPIASYFCALGYKRVVVAGHFGPLGTFGPYYAYDSDGDDTKTNPKARLY